MGSRLVVVGAGPTGLMTAEDRGRAVTTWRCSPAKTYPVPTLDRDGAPETVWTPASA